MNNKNLRFSVRWDTISFRALTTALALSGYCSLLIAAPPENVQVNPTIDRYFLKNKQNEPALAQNPTNPLNLVVGANDSYAEPECTDSTPSRCSLSLTTSISGFYTSFDAGRTWSFGGLLDLSGFGEYAYGDPSLAFDRQGNAYYATLAFPYNSPPGAAPSDLFVARSTDGGSTFTSVAKASGDAQGIFDDKDSIAVGPDPTNPSQDNIYVAWTKLSGGGSHPNQILFARSTDGGATWAKPLHLSSADTTANTFRTGAATKVGPDGTVYVIWLDTKGTPGIFMTTSRDGGNTFLPPGKIITVAAVNDDSLPLSGTSFRQTGRLFPSLTIGPNGTLYVVWCSHTNNHADVWATRSTDGGMTWSTPVSAGHLDNQSAFFASVAADPKNKDKVSVIFQAMDDVSPNTAPGAGVVHYDSFFTQSTDGGATFGAPLRISTMRSDPDGSSLNGLQQQFVGDYITAVSDSQGGRVFAVWTDARNASPCAAVDAYRTALAAGSGATAPDVITQCPKAFGNTDIYFRSVNY
ncbi:neuraminidase (plasmid) [Paraburkholderia sp. PGU19]|uniref:sialidase family protein n=1 Tax=Paraburkholderia sp. PGU19 TaxID=2735434 RepID=UPI0015DB1BA4|nr:sialidase family protein [Paraburkholderia sp. PGU19]BCG04605.1 neuraminidase [Paraburkholderia sp. PGU19]